MGFTSLQNSWEEIERLDREIMKELVELITQERKTNEMD